MKEKIFACDYTSAEEEGEPRCVTKTTLRLCSSQDMVNNEDEGKNAVYRKNGWKGSILFPIDYPLWVSNMMQVF